jgi:transposase
MDILALDLGKYKTVFCKYDSMSGEHEFGKIKTTPQQIHDLIVEMQPDRVVLEICTSAGWVVDIARVLDKEVEVANPLHEAWRWKNIKRKNDKEDALKLAKLSTMNQLPTVHIPEYPVRQKRALIQYRYKLTGRRTQIKNTIRAIFVREGIEIPSGKELWTKSGVDWLAEQACPIEEVSDISQLWQGQLHTELQMLDSVSKAIESVETKLNELAATNQDIQRLQTVAGVGPRLAEALVAFLDDPHRFKSSKQVGSYVGLTPRQYQSGLSDRQGRISGQGNKLLRTLLVEISWTSLRYNPWARQTYDRLLRGSPSRKNIAIVAVARKLLVRCWAMLRDQQDWRYEKEAA